MMDEIKPTFTHGQLYGSKWQRRRRLQLRLEPLCRMCAQQGRVTAAEVADHIEPHRYDINKFILGKLQSLCQGCHSKIKQQREVNGFSCEIGADGFPTDAAHPVYRTNK
jgi:5-methylcytosine-specific restriction endonuclease McrA